MLQAIGLPAACTLVLPAVLQCALLRPSHPAAPMQRAAQHALAAFAAHLPSSAVHRLLLFPLLVHLPAGEHVATALLLVRSYSRLSHATGTVAVVYMFATKPSISAV